MKVYIGIDPGAKGAVAVISQDGELIDARSFTASWLEEYEFLEDIMGQYDVLCGLEKVSSVPGNGVKALFSFGKNVGGWTALLEVLNVPVVEVSPAAWQPKILGAFLKGQSKKVALAYVNKRYPLLQLNSKDGIADAICIALYTRMYK